MKHGLSAELIESLNLVPSCIIIVSPDLSVLMANEYAKNYCRINSEKFDDLMLPKGLEEIFKGVDPSSDKQIRIIKRWFADNFDKLSASHAKLEFINAFPGISYNTLSIESQIGAIIVNFGIIPRFGEEITVSEYELAFRSMTNDTEILISIVDDYGNIKFRNYAWERFMGKGMPNEGRFRWEDSIHHDDMEAFQQHLYEAIQSRSAFSAEFRMQDYLGKYRWLKIRGTPRLNIHNRFLGYICTGIEISEAKHHMEDLIRLNDELLKSHDQLIAKKEELQAAFDAAELGSCSLDIATLKLEMSKEYRNHYGLPLTGDINWEMVTAAVEPEYRTEVNFVLDQAATQGTPVDSTYPIRHLISGERKWMRVVGKVRRNEHNIPISVFAVVMDVTRYMEEENRKNEFIAMVSHELKTPLTSINGFAQLLSYKGSHGKSEAVTIIADKIQRQVKRMGRLIEGFLNISKLDASQLEIIKERFNLIDLIKEMREEFINEISTHEIVFTSTANHVIHADRERIGMVIHNLISNSMKYSPPGSAIIINYKLQDGNLLFSVSDQGIGILPGEEERLFKRYFRSKNRRIYTIAGFGIGLYICAQIIRLHNGLIWAESHSKQNGSTFNFSIPQ
ncbi:sensor histidine kinase [Pedobacter agri]|uniref:sensor histidine kinase n=1 Tax=Pedobacter agri TaxID=454586 RepID=UPI00292F6411|nr:ATP-binding protein [Pedobacter agri]